MKTLNLSPVKKQHTKDVKTPSNGNRTAPTSLHPTAWTGSPAPRPNEWGTCRDLTNGTRTPGFTCKLSRKREFLKN